MDSPVLTRTKEAMRFGEVHAVSMSRQSLMSKGMIRVSPSSCRLGGCTRTGIGAMSGFAAAPYSKMSAVSDHLSTVALLGSPFNMGAGEVGRGRSAS